MNQNEVCSRVNVPFSWELKPGVSKVTHEEGSTIDIRHVTVSLPPPPRLSRSARFCVDDLQAVLPPSQFKPPMPPRSSAKKCFYVNKLEDPFVAAYRKCTECTINGKLGAGDNKNDAYRAKNKRNMFTLSCKYSCTVSSDNVLRVSCSKEKVKEEQKEKDRVDAKLTEQSNVQGNLDKK